MYVVQFTKCSSNLSPNVALSASLKSTFVSQLPPGTTKVNLIFGKFIFDKKSRSNTINYPAPSEENLVTGYLSDHEFDNGCTKKVYEVSDILATITPSLLIFSSFLSTTKSGLQRDFMTLEMLVILFRSKRIDLRLRLRENTCTSYMNDDILTAFMKHAKKNKVKIVAGNSVKTFCCQNLVS